MAALALAAIGFQALSAASGAKAQNKAVAQDYINKLTANVATNKAISEANLTNTIRSGFRVGILNVQRGQAKQQAVKAGYDVSSRGVQALGQSQANAAASGTTGASVDAVSDDIRRKVDEAQGQIDAGWETTQQNFDQQLNDMVQQGIDTLQAAQFADYTPPKIQSVGTAALLGGLQGAASFATSYAIDSMKLGLGSLPSPSGGMSGGGLQLRPTATEGFRLSTPNVGGGFSYPT